MRCPSVQFPNRSQAGVALIEALVAVLILSVGVLGMVGMQAASIRYEQNSWARAAVSTQVSDIADRIRANPGANPTAYAYAQLYSTERASINSDANFFTVATDCMTATCTPAQLATYDLAQWRRNLSKLVPGSVGMVSGASTSTYMVTISWFDKSWLSPAGQLETAAFCTAASAQVAARNCCPEALVGSSSGQGIPGVRCVNFAVVP